MNENLTWNHHIVSLKGKLNKAIGLLQKLGTIFPKN